MTIDQAHEIYAENAFGPCAAYCRDYAETVGRFREGFLADGVTDDIDVAFTRAVDATQRLVKVLKARNA